MEGNAGGCTWSCEAPMQVGACTLVALRCKTGSGTLPLLRGARERSASERRSHHTCWFSAGLTPVAVVLCTADGQRALSVSGEVLDLARLRQQVPGLDTQLRQCPGAAAHAD